VSGATIRFLIALTLLVLAGCSSNPKTFPASGSYVANAAVQLTPNLNIPVEKMVFWGVYAGVAYWVLDPLTPNWSIEEAQLSDTHYHLTLHMKRVYAGGAGEATQAFNQRAKDVAHFTGATGFEVLEYSEGLESSVLGSRRVTTGVFRLTGLDEKSTKTGLHHPTQSPERVIE
jgi:hypothetical protein